MSKNQQKQAVRVTYHKVNRHIKRGKYRDDQSDLCVVAERWKDEETGEIVKHLKLVENYPRPFWITKKQYRTHKDKREWARRDEVEEYRTPHHNLSYAVQKALGHFNPDPSKRIRVVNRDPYVYGTDLPPTYFIKEIYSHKYKDYNVGYYDVCILDIETDVLGKFDASDGNEAIIMLSMVMNGKAYELVLEDFVKGHQLNVEETFFNIWRNDMPVDVVKKYDVQLKLFKDEKSMIEFAFDILHNHWKPDIVAGWNVMKFDQDRIAKRYAELGGDPAVLFSDPSIPDKYKGYYFKEGKLFSISDSGKKMNLRPIQAWHEVIAPAHFQWIDAMCVYYQLRKVKGMESSYKLDAILDKHLKRGKYEIPEAEDKRGLNKHIFMQREFPIHYAVYNLYDSVGLDLLDQKTLDLRSTFMDMLADNDYSAYSSNPTKAMTSFQTYLYRGNDQFVLGSTSDMMFNHMDKRLPPLDGWIVALPTVLLEDSGLKCLKHMTETRTKVYTHCGDIDIESSYPWTGIYMNLSRMTTEIEVSEIIGLSRHDRYTFGLNLMGGRVNALSNARIAFQLPELIEMEAIFDDEYAKFLAERK